MASKEWSYYVQIITSADQYLYNKICYYTTLINAIFYSSLAQY